MFKKIVAYFISSRGRIPLILISLSIIFFITFLIDKYWRSKEQEEGQVIGNVLYRNNIIQRKGDRDRIWSDLNNKSLLYIRDIVRAGELSNAEINLIDGTKLKIEENSMLRLDFTGKIAQLHFERGAIRIEQGSENKNSIEINTGGKKVELQNAVIKLDSFKKNVLDNSIENNKLKNTSINKNNIEQFINLSVEKGEVKFVDEKSNKITKVEQNQKVNFSNKQKLNISDLPYLLLEPKDSINLNLVSNKNKIPVIFRWIHKSNKIYDFSNTKDKLEVSTSRNFKNIFISLILPSTKSENSKILKLNPGTYYWRVVQINNDKKNAVSNINSRLQSEIYKFNIIENESVKLYHPSPKNDYVEYYTRNYPRVYFSWSKSDKFVNYKLVIARNDKLTFDRKEINLENITNYNLELISGKYYWQVSYISPINGKSISSQISNFSIVKGTEKKVDKEEIANKKVLNSVKPSEMDNVSVKIKNYNSIEFQKYISNLNYSCEKKQFIPDALILKCYPTHVTLNLKGWFRAYLYFYLLMQNENNKARFEAYNYFRDHCDFVPSYELAKKYKYTKIYNTSLEMNKINSVIKAHEKCQKQ